MQQITWSGVLPAALTMFTASGDLDKSATAEHLKLLVAEGAHGVVVGGTSGEFASLTEAERRELIDVAVQAVDGHVPVVVGTGFCATAQTIELTDYAAAAGADAAIVILPYYQRPNETEVLAHFRAIGRASRIPIIVYNNPANSAAPALGTSALRELYREDCARGVKSTFPTVHQVHELRAVVDDGFRVFYGSFTAPLEGLAGGAHGWISGILNVATLDAVELWRAIQASDLAAARAAWNRILPIKLLYTSQQLGPVNDLAIYRAMLDLRGQWGGHCRLPLLDLNPDQRQQLERLLRRDTTLVGSGVAA